MYANDTCISIQTDNALNLNEALTKDLEALFVSPWLVLV